MTNPRTTGCGITRRRLLGAAGVAAFGAVPAPAARLALARCPSYGPELLPALSRMFDQPGGLGRLVKGKTVAVKINLTGNPDTRLGYLPIGRTTWSWSGGNSTGATPS